MNNPSPEFLAALDAVEREANARAPLQRAATKSLEALRSDDARADLLLREATRINRLLAKSPNLNEVADPDLRDSLAASALILVLTSRLGVTGLRNFIVPQ